MSNESGTTPINIPQLDKVVDALNKAENATCTEINLLIKEATSGIHDLMAGIAKEIVKLEGIIPLLSLPGIDPFAIVSWLSKLVTGLIIPQLKSMLNLVVQLVKLAEKFFEMISSIQILLPKVAHCNLNLEGLLGSISSGIDAVFAPVMSTIGNMQTALLSFAPHIDTSVLLDTSSVSNFKSSTISNASDFHAVLSSI